MPVPKFPKGRKLFWGKHCFMQKLWWSSVALSETQGTLLEHQAHLRRPEHLTLSTAQWPRKAMVKPRSASIQRPLEDLQLPVLASPLPTLFCGLTESYWGWPEMICYWSLTRQELTWGTQKSTGIFKCSCVHIGLHKARSLQ